MKKILIHVCFISLFLLHTLLVNAQENSTQWYDMGGYQYSGGISVDYRGTSINGLDGRSDYYAKERYNEAYNYRNGLLISDIHLFGQPINDQSKGLFDEMYLNATGINDPYTTIGLRLRTFNTYDFNVTYRRSAYYMNRQDSLWSGDHKFDFARQMLNATFTYDFSNSIALELNYNGGGRNGNELTTASPYYYGVSSKDVSNLLGGYSTSNIYWMNTPRNDWTNDFGCKLNFKLNELKTNLVLGAGYRKLSQDVTYSPDVVNGDTTGYSSLYYYAGSNLGTSNATQTPNANGLIGGNPRNETLYQFKWEDQRNSKTPYYFGQFVTIPTQGLSLSGNLRYESTTGTSINSGIQEGLIRTTTALKDSNKLQNYYATTNGTADMSFKRMMGALLLTYKINNQIQLTADYKYQSDDEQSNSNILLSTTSNTMTSNHDYSNSVFNHDTTASNVKYKSTMHTISPQLIYSPMSNLNLRAGLTYIIKTPSYHIDTLAAPINTSPSLYNTNLSKQTKTISPFFSIYYKPIDMLKLRVRYELTQNNSYYDASTLGVWNNNVQGNTIGQPYTGAAPQYDRLTPDTKTTLNLSADADLTDKLYLSLDYKSVNSKGNLLPWYAYYNSQLSQSSATATGAIYNMQGDVNLKSSISAVTANVRYMIDDNSMIQVSAQYNINKWSIPFSGVSAIQDLSNSSGTVNVTDANSPFNQGKTVLIDQNIKDTYLDVSLFYSITKELKITLGGTLINSTGGGIITPDNNQLVTKASATALPITNPRPDDPWVGGPYALMQLHARVHYQFSRNLGAALDFQNVSLNEKVQGSYVGFSDFLGNLFKISLMYNL